MIFAFFSLFLCNITQALSGHWRSSSTTPRSCCCSAPSPATTPATLNFPNDRCHVALPDHNKIHSANIESTPPATRTARPSACRSTRWSRRRTQASPTTPPTRPPLLRHTRLLAEWSSAAVALTVAAPLSTQAATAESAAGVDAIPPDDIGVFLDAALARAALEAACDEPLDVQGADVDEGPLGTLQREDDVAPPRAEIDETRLGEPATAAPATAEATDDSSSSSTCRPLNLRTRPLLEWGTFATEPPMPTHPAVGNTRRSIRIAARAERVGLQAEDRTDAAATAAGMEEGCRAWRDDLQPGAST